MFLLKTFRIMLHLYPREFQEDYGSELGLAFRDSLRHCRTFLDRMLLLLLSLRGILIEAPAEHLRILARDIRLSWSAAKKEPLSSAIIVITLALTLGANATLLGIVDQLLLQPVQGVADPHRVLRVYGAGYWTALTRSWPDYLDLRDNSSAFSNVAAYQSGRVLVGRNSTRKLRLDAVTSNYFATLGVKPQIGRLFSENQDRGGTPTSLAVLSYRYWNSEFAANPEVLGQSLRIADKTYTIIGVADKNFVGVDPAETMLWTQLGELRRDRGNYGAVQVVGRIRDGLTIEQADQEANRANQAGLRADGLKAEQNVMKLGALAITQGPNAPQEIQVSKWLVIAACVVMLAGWSNVTQLLTARALRRAHQTAIHVALGASRRRLMRQWLSESLAFALLGGAGALWMMATLRHLVYGLLLPELALPGWTIGLRELGITSALTLLAGFLTGLGPARQSFSDGLLMGLKQAQRAGSLRWNSLHRGLVMVQVALTVVVLVSAGLFLQSLDRVLSIDPGFDLDHLLVVHVDEKWASQHSRLAQRARELPGVAAAGLANAIPGESAWRTRFYLEGRDPERFYSEGGGRVNLLSTFIDSDAMQALGLKLKRGRWFQTADQAGSERVAIVNEQLVSELWPGQEPIGKCLHLMQANAPCTRVVGLVNSSRVENWFDPAPAQYYIPLSQPLREETPAGLLIRTHGDPGQLATAVQRDLQRLLPPEAQVEVRKLRSVIEPIVRPWRLGSNVLVALGGLALFITLVGVFGLLSFVIATRAQEWTVRQAMGATPFDIAKRVFQAMATLVLPGLLVGTAIALAASKWIASLLFGVQPGDFSPYLLAASLILLLAVLASLMPMRRATRLNLSMLLRQD